MVILFACMQVFAGLAALCGAIAISKVEFEYIDDEAEYIQRNSANWEYAINFNVLMCCVLLLLASGGTLIIEIIMLVVSVVKKSSKAVVIVVSYSYPIVNWLWQCVQIKSRDSCNVDVNNAYLYVLCHKLKTLSYTVLKIIM